MKFPILNSRPFVYGTIVVSLIVYFLITFTAKAGPLKRLMPRVGAELRNGDIVFQSGDSRQCVAVKLATHSPYSHCGIYLTGSDGKAYIYEAVQPVKKTPVAQWIQQGNGGIYTAVRLNNAQQVINDSTSALLLNEANKYINRDYDIYFGWGDDKIYCSEYVWKIYKNALNIEICPLSQLKDFDLSSKEVKHIMQERYGSHIPYEEKVVAPSDLYAAPTVTQVNK